MMWTLWTILSLVVSALAIGVAVYFYKWVQALPVAEGNIDSISKLIRKGAFTFLKREYRILTVFVGIVSILLLIVFPSPVWKGGISENILAAVSYIAGAALSALAGYVGISIATLANVRSASAAKKGLAPSYMAGFRGGAVMGMAVVSTALAAAALLQILTGNADLVIAFSFGASSLALFAKAGGGIFTKTADIAADLTGKVELGIPEDDPRNPAVIADNVGDNVGDVAGMGADLFDSQIASLAAALVIAASLGKVEIEMVFCFSALGLLASIIGVLFARVGPSGDPGKALNGGTLLTCGIFAILTLAATLLTPEFNIRIWGAAFLGMLVGVIIGFTSEFFTGDDKKPVEKVAEACKSGPAFTILSGISYGLVSIMPSIIGIGVAALGAYKLVEPLGVGYPMFGISIAAIGMLSIVGMIISNDAYGPIVDNARGLAEMGNLGDDVLEITDKLDAAGNTAKAITKGFAIGAAGLTVIALLGAFQEIVESVTGEIISFNLMDPLVFFGTLVGAAIPAVFSAMLMLGVNRNSQLMVQEIHRQFDTIEGLKEGKPGVMPDYNKCIDIATVGSIKELIPAGLTAIVITLVVGFIGGVQAMGGYLAGNIVTGLFLALLMSNAGGLWDNAKKYIEAGNCGGKGSDAHKAAVIGDTVGDPFKDTAGPSINTQITVVSLVASITATLFATFSIFG
ncbi:MAG: sodium-translocating pyrophosphatase [Caldicoprobacterales bacterium]|jgi:K(+)-stimulated pyrophosphate-energized sodium pump|nr:sodium-translocating pyrophosphatase [Clostridiales bacterium]